MLTISSDIGKLTSAGLWKDPVKSHQWVGNLTYSPSDGCDIEVYTENNDLDIYHLSGEFELIKWNGFDGVPCTIIDAFCKEGTGFNKGGQRRTIFGNHMLYGVHIDSKTQPIARELAFRSPALVRWSQPKNISVTWNSASNIVANYLSPPPVDFCLEGLADVIIWWSASAKACPMSDGEYNIVEQSAIQFSFFNEKSFNDLLDIISAMEFYANFASNLFAGPPECNLLIDNGDMVVRRVLLHRSWYGKEHDHDPRAEYFRFCDVKENLPYSLSLWFESYKKHRDAVQLYSLIRTRKYDIQSELLYLARCVEALARDLFPCDEPSKAEDRKIGKVLRKALRENFDSSFQEKYGDRICRKLVGLGRSSFQDRLIYLNKHLSGSIREVCPKFDSLVPIVAKWRNDLTHCNPTEMLNQDIFDELCLCRDLLKMCVEAIFFRLMSVSDDKAARTLSQHYAWQFRKTLPKLLASRSP